ncbi:MAG: hypothetical protein M1546_16365 [Chloroflexi bacterium]|nr:hypothetical protein [Chloroflexota bacterium]
MTPPQPSHESRPSNFALKTIAIALISFGLTMFVLSAAYARDLIALASAPFDIWSALCGQPTDNPLAQSILVSLSLVSLLAGIGLFIYTMRHSR